jgi:hypothetical protein
VRRAEAASEEEVVEVDIVVDLLYGGFV